jgi:hypothetical protein
MPASAITKNRRRSMPRTVAPRSARVKRPRRLDVPLGHLNQPARIITCAGARRSVQAPPSLPAVRRACGNGEQLACEQMKAEPRKLPRGARHVGTIRRSTRRRSTRRRQRSRLLPRREPSCGHEQPALRGSASAPGHRKSWSTVRRRIARHACDPAARNVRASMEDPPWDDPLPSSL